MGNPLQENIHTEAFVVVTKGAPFKLHPVILDSIRPDELLIEMAYTGICHSDIVMQQGLMSVTPFPVVLGHEGAGYIRGIGSSVQDKTLSIGDAVLLSFNTCASCPPCMTKHTGHCREHTDYNLTAKRTEDGSSPFRMARDDSKVHGQFFGQSSFSRMSVVKEQCVVKCAYPENLAIYAPMGCGFQTGAGTILNTLKPTPQSSVVIFGMGSVGLAALMATKYLGVNTIIAVDIVDEKLDLAKELGATIVINSMQEKNVVAKVLEITEGLGVDFAVDCTGIMSVVETMIEALGHCGTAAMVGILPEGKNLTFNPLKFMLGCKRLIGVICGESNPPEFIPEMIRMHQEGHFPIEKMCRTYPAENIEEALHDLHAGKVIKPVLKW